jgi:hypothetical protein
VYVNRIVLLYNNEIMKKVIYIPGQKKECFFKGTLDKEQEKKLLKQNEKLRSKIIR